MPLTAHLDILGMTGQIARLLGASRVVGSAGSASKVRYLIEDLGYDAAFDYHVPDLRAALAGVAPSGIDVYFDNVGDDHLEAAFDAIRPHGRVVVCGAINQYNQLAERPAPPNLITVLTQRLRVEGFTVREHLHAYAQFVEQATEWLRAGKLVSTATVVDGLAHAIDAFRDMLHGANRGKMLVRLADDPG